MKRVFIINPSSRRGKANRELPEIETYFKKTIGAFEPVFTKSRQDTEQQTRAALKAGVEQIIAMGGDGTVNAVVNGFFENGNAINPDAVLAVSQSGTGSDYFKAITAERAIDWKKLVVDFKARPVDVGHIEFLSSTTPSVHFVNVANIGIGAEVVRKKNASPFFIPVGLSYSLPALGALLSYRPFPTRLIVDSTEVEVSMLNLFIAKGSHLGSGMQLRKEATLDDGKLEVIYFEAMPFAKKLLKFLRLMNGTLWRDLSVKRQTGTHIEVHTRVPKPVEFDGEMMGTTPVRISLKTKVLKVCFPIG